MQIIYFIFLPSDRKLKEFTSRFIPKLRRGGCWHPLLNWPGQINLTFSYHSLYWSIRAPAPPLIIWGWARCIDTFNFPVIKKAIKLTILHIQLIEAIKWSILVKKKVKFLRNWTQKSGVPSSTPASKREWGEGYNCQVTDLSQNTNEEKKQISYHFSVFLFPVFTSGGS